jgi:hypothetical protein
MSEQSELTTIEKLCATQVAFEHAEGRYEVLRDERNALIRHALEEGVAQVEIAGATGLTRGRISQIVSPFRSPPQ